MLGSQKGIEDDNAQVGDMQFASLVETPGFEGMYPYSRDGRDPVRK